MSALTFKFDDSPVNVIDRNGSLWFVAADVVRALHLSNTSVSLKALRPFDKDKIEINGKETNIISESGMYFLTLRSQDALKEGTPAYRFSLWVTSEVLPAIRKQGRYECPIATLTPAQQLQLREAVAKRAKAVSAHYQTIYRALYQRFQVPRYTEILAKDFDKAISFIQMVDLRVPEKVAEKAPDPETKSQERTFSVSKDFVEKIRVFVYYWRYLHRPDLERFLKLMEDLNSPYAARFAEAIKNLNLIRLESNLEELGFPVAELPAYKALLSAE